MDREKRHSTSSLTAKFGVLLRCGSPDRRATSPRRLPPIEQDTFHNITKSELPESRIQNASGGASEETRSYEEALAMVLSGQAGAEDITAVRRQSYVNVGTANLENRTRSNTVPIRPRIMRHETQQEEAENQKSI